MSVEKVSVNAGPGYYFSQGPEDGGKLKAATGKDPAVLYDRSHGEDAKVGAAVAGPLSRTNIYVWVRMPPNAGSKPIISASTESGIVFKGLWWRGTTDQPGVEWFEVTANLDGRKAPWSVRESVNWTFSSDTIDSLSIGSTQIELYGLCEQLPSYLTKPGIPLQLLRLFLPGAPNCQVRNEDDWIKWVTHICHGTQDPTKPFGELRKTSEDHWLKYHVWYDAYSFVGEEGGNFNLDAWIDAYESWLRDKTCFTCVNCFDQAGIAEIVLSLGIPYGRIFWEHVQPFGYIPTTDLVGWGLTNNPYFDGDAANKILADPLDPKRCPFRNHVFLSISPEVDVFDQGPGSKIVDACAGPADGTLSYSDYLGKAVDKGGDADQLKYFKPSTWTKVGVTGSQWKHPEHYKPQNLNDILRAQYPGDTENLQAIFEGILGAYGANCLSPIFNLKAVMDSVDGMLKAAKNLTELDEKKVAPVVLPGGGEIRERKWLGRADGDSWTFISVKVSRYQSVDEACKQLQTRLALFTPPQDEAGGRTIRVKPSKTTGIQDTNIQVFGNVHLSLFVYKNALVEVSGNAVRSHIDEWTRTMLDTMKSEDKP